MGLDGCWIGDEAWLVTEGKKDGVGLVGCESANLLAFARVGGVVNALGTPACC